MLECDLAATCVVLPFAINSFESEYGEGAKPPLGNDLACARPQVQAIDVRAAPRAFRCWPVACSQSALRRIIVRRRHLRIVTCISPKVSLPNAETWEYISLYQIPSLWSNTDLLWTSHDSTYHTTRPDIRCRV